VTRGEDLTWRQAGGAYYAEMEGRIVALLYWYGQDVHYLRGPGSEELADLREATRVALEAATRVVIGCLDLQRG
jgi:hypothetical protein